MGKPEMWKHWKNFVGLLGPGKTFCALAPGAVEPLQSALKYFRAEFEAGVSAVTSENKRPLSGIQPNLLAQRW